MRRLGIFTLAVIVAGLLSFVVAQSFSGTFVSSEGDMSITFQQGQDGALTGVITGQTGQYQLQGQANGLAAYGVADSQQGQLGFQAELGGDGQSMQLMFYQAGANNQPTPVSPMIVLQRQAGMGGGAPGGMPGQMPGGVPGQAPGGIPGQMPGGYPGQAPGGVPGQIPGQMPGGIPGQNPGGGTGMFPPTSQVPPAGGMPDWNGTFIGNAGNTVLVVQGGQGAYSGYIKDEGQQYQFQAHLDETTLHGQLMANGSQYEFWADRDGSTVYLYVGSNTYFLEYAGTP